MISLGNSFSQCFCHVDLVKPGFHLIHDNGGNDLSVENWVVLHLVLIVILNEGRDGVSNKLGFGAAMQCKIML
jgi:hypothetical protein